MEVGCLGWLDGSMHKWIVGWLARWAGFFAGMNLSFVVQLWSNKAVGQKAPIPSKGNVEGKAPQ